ncbi:MAG: BlaI/MecI/CopY family transcriptional regulator [Caulobacteraceae bacterium]
MLVPQISDLGLRIMEALWAGGPSSIRDIHDGLASDDQPQINTTRATFHRLLHNGYVRQVRQVHRSAVFEAAVTRDSVYNSVIDGFAELFGDNMTAVITRLVDTGRLAPADLDALRQRLQEDEAGTRSAGRPKLVRGRS